MQIQEVSASGRVNRSPKHTFHVRHKPFQIQPFMIAPVLPGETMKNALLQTRALTDPIKNGLIGWWLEHYLFYVKHRDLEVDWVETMMLDPDFDFTTVDDPTASAAYYFKGGQINWVKLCTDKIVEHYFRNEDEIANSYLIDGLHAASLQNNGWWDSMYRDAAFTDVDIVVGGDDTISASEIDATMRQWEFMRANNLTAMSYEDFLSTYGVRPEKVKLHKPELIRYSRDFQYPSNAVDGDGAVSSAVSWAIAERADKARYFAEPGFVIGITVARPKVYLDNQDTAAVAMLRDPYSWLPAVLRNDPATSLRSFTNTGGPLTGQASGYWVDVRDLFMYGDQFVNFAQTATDYGNVALPTADLQRRFPSYADVQGFFSGANYNVKQDGVCSLSISGALRDHTLSGGQVASL